ncbi:hypothetical protein EV643_12576 [Kribbella sp. VKM Ac-2527]|uniref:Probable membrane transporter protein n=1 Tax=Kribbella caucasensis TaxID=2512215 RepID=A0A4R6JFW8_9ACTN|nr:sulfite exporter TauE/SafE family protein [Kribbella sp. VKM Ac-2527]TDO34819.1 hypothetical protein EV643_12576 [Kribbella sp. VKM Ac-2527]
MDTQVVLLAGGVAAGAVTQRVTGVGFALVASPLLVLVAGPFQGVVLSNVLALLTSLAVLAATWRDVDLKQGLQLAVPALAMIPLGAFVARRVPAPLLMVLVGTMVLVALLAVQFSRRARMPRGMAGTLAAGAASGFMNVTAGVGGPAIVLYAVSTNWDHRKFAATFQLYAVVINLASLAAKGGVQVSASTLLISVAALTAGLVGGHVLAVKLGGEHARQLVIALSAIGAAAIVVKGLLSW